MNIPDRWTFETEDVADAFDTHVREQLPWYDIVTEGLVQIARHYIQPSGLVYDIGAGNGNVGRALGPILEERMSTLVAIDSSHEMCARYNGPGRIERAGAAEFDYQPFDLAVAMLTLMFIQPADLAGLLDRLVANIRPGGALILVERTLPPPGYPSIVTSRMTLAAKAGSGATPADILAKELSLSGVQRPIDGARLLDRGAVEWFRFGDFAGYLIEAAA